MQKYLIIMLLLGMVLACGEDKRQVRKEKRENKKAAFIEKHNVDIDVDTLDLEYTIDVQDLRLPKRLIFSANLRDVERVNEGIIYTFETYSNSVFRIYDDKNLLQNYEDDFYYGYKIVADIKKIKKVGLSIESEYELGYDGESSYIDDMDSYFSVSDLFVFYGELIDFTNLSK